MHMHLAGLLDFYISRTCYLKNRL